VGIPLGGSNRNSSSQSTAPTKSSLNKGYGGRSCERDRRGGREILGLKSGLRTDDGRPFVTDNWKVIIDLRIGLIADAPAVERSIRSIPGVVDTGSF
jgi:hypothetical protein